MQRFLVVAAAAVCATSAVSAQSVSGTYDVEYAARMIVKDAPQQTETMNKVKLVLEQKGDSVIAKWQLVSPMQMPVEELRGTLSGNQVRLFGTANAKLRGPSGEQSLTMTQEYVIVIQGDEIKGTIEVHPPEGISISGPPRTFTGKRAG